MFFKKIVVNIIKKLNFQDCLPFYFRNVSFTFNRSGSGSDFRTAGDGNITNTIISLLGTKLAKVHHFIFSTSLYYIISLFFGEYLFYIQDLIILNHKKDDLCFSLKGYMSRPNASCTAQNLQERQVILL